MKTIKNFDNINVSQFSDLFDYLSNYIFDDKKILIAVSGGPDSMFLSVLIYNFFVKNNLDLNNLHFIHCNHKTRKETKNEQIFVENFFDGLNLSVSLYGKKIHGHAGSCNDSLSEKKDENSLRNWRYAEFQKILDSQKVDFLLTGHNLTDRIESSFMNMFRGAGLNGFSSMKFADQSPLIKDSIVLRPLLQFTKGEIENFCKIYDIPFVIDPTNFDSKTSLRNTIRLGLFSELAKLSNKYDEKSNTFFESMKKIYFELDEKEKELDLGSFVEIPKSYYRNSEFALLRDIPLSFVSKNLLLRVLKKFNVSSNIQTKTLDDLVKFFANSKQGYKYIGGVYFFLSHGKIYIIKAKENFWEKYIEKSLIIDKLGKLEIGKESVNLIEEKLLGLEIRFPKMGDKFGSKSWSKYCINNKIPIFWRNFIPVVVDGNNIVKDFYIGGILNG